MDTIPIIKLIKKMTAVDPKDRISVEQASKQLKKLELEIITKAFLEERGFPDDILFMFYNYDSNDVRDQMSQLINESRFSHETVEENENKIYTDYEMLNSRMSRHIHSQGYTFINSLNDS